MEFKAAVLPNVQQPEPPPPYYPDLSGAPDMPVPSAPGFVNSGVTVPQQPQQPMQVQSPMVITTVVPLGRTPAALACPHCRAQIQTRTTNQPGLLAWIAGGILCLFGCICGCCLIPCCVCKDVEHYCPKCHQYLGKYSY